MPGFDIRRAQWHQTGEIQQVVAATIRHEMDGLRTFLDRRIAELSAEIHATVQMVDFSEVNLSEQLSAIRQQITSVVAAPSAATRNSGLELEAVVHATEEAANRIMEAAEAIGDWLREGNHDTASMEVVNEKVNAIFEACSFQDVTGQTNPTGDPAFATGRTHVDRHGARRRRVAPGGSAGRPRTLQWRRSRDRSAIQGQSRSWAGGGGLFIRLKPRWPRHNSESAPLISSSSLNPFDHDPAGLRDFMFSEI